MNFELEKRPRNPGSNSDNAPVFRGRLFSGRDVSRGGLFIKFKEKSGKKVRLL
jgi:hypothetical protein